MVKLGSLQAQSAVNQQLPRRRLQQVSSAHHLGNLHRVIVHYDGELISRNIISSPDHKIPKVAACNILLPSEMLIIKPDFLTVGNAKTPIHSGRLLKTASVISTSTIPWIDRLIVEIVGGARGSS